MKTNTFSALVIVVGLLIFGTGCSSSRGSVAQEDSKEYSGRDTWTLKDHLRRANGVRLTGTEGSMRVIIRGESSVANPSSQPLFTIDDQKAGRNFNSVDEMLHEGEINYIEVLPPSKATRYGMEGNFGVIRIFTKD